MQTRLSLPHNFLTFGIHDRLRHTRKQSSDHRATHRVSSYVLRNAILAARCQENYSDEGRGPLREMRGKPALVARFVRSFGRHDFERQLFRAANQRDRRANPDLAHRQVTLEVVDAGDRSFADPHDLIAFFDPA